MTRPSDKNSSDTPPSLFDPRPAPVAHPPSLHRAWIDVKGRDGSRTRAWSYRFIHPCGTCGKPNAAFGSGAIDIERAIYEFDRQRDPAPFLGTWSCVFNTPHP